MPQLIDLAEHLSHGDAVILDLRGNPGGDREAARDVIRSFIATPLRQPAIDDLESEVTLQGELDAAICDRDPDARARIRTRLDAAAATEPKKTITHLETAAMPAIPLPGGAIPILIVDRACSGACEEAVYFARQHAHAVVIGEPTAGALEYGEPRSYRLPASGLWMSAATRRLVATPPDRIDRAYMPTCYSTRRTSTPRSRRSTRAPGRPRASARCDPDRI